MVKILRNTRFLELLKKAVEKTKRGRGVDAAEAVEGHGKGDDADDGGGCIMIDAMGRETSETKGMSMIDVEAVEAMSDVEEPTWVSCSRCS